MKHLFHAIDSDRRGSIERAEFDAALTRLGLGMSSTQLAELWAGLDADGNGVVDYSELLSEVSPKHHRRKDAAAIERLRWSHEWYRCARGVALSLVSCAVLTPARHPELHIVPGVVAPGTVRGGSNHLGLWQRPQ